MDTISIIYGNADIIAFENNSWVEGGYRFQTCIPGICSDVRSGNGNTNINFITLQKDSSNLKILVNGQLQDNHNEVFENTDTSTADLKIILSGLKFNNGGLNDRNLIGRIGEIIIVAGEVSNENNLKINNYLSNKWNLTSTIDSDGDGILDASDPFPTDPSKWISFPQELRDNASDNFTAINGLALWLDASNVDGDKNSSLSDGDAVGEWKDLSGNGNDLTQTLDSTKPSLANATLNGLSTLSFNSDSLFSTKNIIQGYSDLTVIALYKTNQQNSDQGTVFIGETEYGKSIGLGYHDDNGYHNFQWGVIAIASKIKEFISEFNVQSLTLDTSQNELGLYLNGKNYGVSESSNISISSGIKVGQARDNQKLNGSIAEVLIFSKKINDLELAKINNYPVSYTHLTLPTIYSV